MRRNHVTRNVATLAVPPRIEEGVEPYDTEELQRLRSRVAKLRNSVRWSIALALGLRQGEARGLRSKYLHGCGGDCGTKPGYCMKRVRENEATAASRDSSSPLRWASPWCRAGITTREAAPGRCEHPGRVPARCLAHRGNGAAHPRCPRTGRDADHGQVVHSDGCPLPV